MIAYASAWEENCRIHLRNQFYNIETKTYEWTDPNASLTFIGLLIN